MSNNLSLLILPLLEFTVGIGGERRKLQPELCCLGLLLQTQPITVCPWKADVTTVVIDVRLLHTKELTSESGLSGFKDFRFALFFCDNEKIRKS